MRRLLRTHQNCLPQTIVPTAGFLMKRFAAVQSCYLPIDFERQRSPNPANRIEIFQFDLRTELGFLLLSDGNIAVAAELTFLHVCIADTAINQCLLERSQVGEGLFGRLKIRLGHYLHQWSTGPVEVYPARRVEVKAFGDIFFQMYPD